MGRETDSSDDSNLKNRIPTPDSCRKGKIHECHYYGCGAVFNRAWRLENHILSIHEGKKLFECKVDGCDKSYTKNAHLKRHVFNRHDEHSFKTVFICPELDCQRHVSSDSNLRKHYNNVHSKLFSCTYCNNTFPKRRQLSAHMFTHTGVPPFRCDKCDIGCASEYELKRHQRGHKTHTCTVTGCNLTFDLWTQLRKHAKLEHPLHFACVKCNKVFKTKHNLKLHIAIHEDPDKREVLTCPHDNCPRFYFHKRNLTHHIQSSHLGKLQECKHPGCGRKLCTKQKLQDHMKLHNPYGPLPRRRNQQTKERKKRSDAGKHKRSAAVKLSGLVVPYEVEKQLLHAEDGNNTVMSDAIKISSLKKQVTISYSDLNVQQINDKTKYLEETHSEPSSLVLFQGSKKDHTIPSYHDTISTSNAETLNEIAEKLTNELLLLLPDKSKNMNKSSSISKSIQPSSPTINPMLNLCSLVKNSKFLQLTNSSSFNFHAKNDIVSNLESDDIVQEVPDSLSSLQKSDHLLKKRKCPFETDSIVCKKGRLVNSKKAPYENTHANLRSEKDKSKFKFNKATSENSSELIRTSEGDEQIMERKIKSSCVDKTIIVEDVSQSKIFTSGNNSIIYFGRKSEETQNNNFVSTIKKIDIGRRKIDTFEFILCQNTVKNTVAHSLAETAQSKCNSINLSNSKQTIAHHFTGTNTNTSSNCKINCSQNVNKKETLKKCSTSLKLRKNQRINKVIDDIVNACFMKKTNVENDKASINSKSNNLTNETKEINNAKSELTGNINIDTFHETSNVSPERIFYNNEQQNAIITELVQNTKLTNYFTLKNVCSQTKDNDTSFTDIYSCSWIEKTKECLPLSNSLSFTCHSRDSIVFNLELNDILKDVHNTLQGRFNKQFVNNKLPLETDLVECRRRLAESKETHCENTHENISSNQETSKIELDKAVLASINCTHLPGDELFSTVNIQKTSQPENTSISSQEKTQTNKHLEIYMNERQNVLGHVSVHDKEIISRHEFKFDPSIKSTQEQGTSLSISHSQVLVASTTKNVTHNLSPHNSFDVDNTLRVYTSKKMSDCENIEKGSTLIKKINKEMVTDLSNESIPVGCGDTINKRKLRRNCLTNKNLNNILIDKQSDHKVITNIKSQNNIINKDSQNRNGGEFSEGNQVTVEESLKDYSLIVEESKNNIVIDEKLEKNVLLNKNSKDSNKNKGSEGRIAINELKEDIGVYHSEGKIAVDDPEENIVEKKELEKDILVDKRLKNKATLYQKYDKQIEVKEPKCNIKTVGTSKNILLAQNIEKDKVHRYSENNVYLSRFNTGIEENYKKYNIDEDKYHNIETNEKLLYNIEAHEESDGNIKIGEESDEYTEINESERDIDIRQESDMNAKIKKALESDIEIIQSERNSDLHQGSDMHAKIIIESEQAIEIKESERDIDLIQEAQEYLEIDKSEKDFNANQESDGNSEMSEESEEDNDTNESERDSDESDEYIDVVGVDEEMVINVNNTDKEHKAKEDSDEDSEIDIESKENSEINIDSEEDSELGEDSEENSELGEDSEENKMAEEFITFNEINKTEYNIKTGNSHKYNLIDDKMIEDNKEHGMEIDVEHSDLNVEENEGKEIIGEAQNKHKIKIDVELLTGGIGINEGLNENVEICEEFENVNELKEESNENVEICEKDFEINEESDEYIDVGIEEVNIRVEATEKDNKLEEESDVITVEEGFDYDAIDEEEDDDTIEEEYGKHSKIEEETKVNKCVEKESKDKNEDQLVKETTTTNSIGITQATNFGCYFKEDELKELFMINEQMKTQNGPGNELKNGSAFHKHGEIDTVRKNEDKKETTTKKIIKKGENKRKHVVFNLVPSSKKPNTAGYSSKLERKPCSCLLCKKSGVNDRAIFKKLDEMDITRSFKKLVGKVMKGRENIPMRREVTANPERTLSSFHGTDEDKPGKMMGDGTQLTNIKKVEDISPTNLKNFIAMMLSVMEHLFPLINEGISENYKMETDENRTEENVKEVVLRISLSPDKFRYNETYFRSGDWVIAIEFLQEAAITSLASDRNGMPEEIKSHIISADENKTSIQVKTASLSCDNVPLKDYTPVLACNETILESLVNLKLLSSQKETEDEDINVEVFCEDSDDEDVWKCCDCGESFRNRKRLEKHMFSHVYELHTQYNNKQYKGNTKRHDCVPDKQQKVKENACHSDFRQGFKTREKIDQQKLPNGEELHTHLICEQSVKQKIDLESQTLDHTEVKPYKCLYCGKYFLQHSALVDHLALHNKQTKYHCAECGKEFSKELSLKRHKLTHTEKRTHKCDDCGAHFKFSSHLFHHKKIHRIQELYKCSICGENFKENRDLLIHETVHTNDQLLTCPVCRQSFNSKVSFENHFVTHKMEKPFKCLTCGVSFMLNASLIRHSTIHNSQSYKCTDCGKLVRSKSGLKRHIETHMPEKAFKCAVCDQQFRTKENLLRHSDIHTNNRPFECADCGRCFRQKVNMKTHIVNEHINNIFYKCYECDKRFKSILTLNRHMLVHDERNALKCFECDKCFVYRCHLNRHMRMHTGEKPFRCLDCGKCFGFKSSLKYHQLNHTGARPHKCEMCGFCFRSSKELKEHVLIHTNERPFACPDCRFCFRRKTHLKKHSMLHDVERPCKCVDCGLSFNRQSLLRRHITMYHSDSHFLSQSHYFLNT